MHTTVENDEIRLSIKKHKVNRSNSTFQATVGVFSGASSPRLGAYFAMQKAFQSAVKGESFLSTYYSQLQVIKISLR